MKKLFFFSYLMFLPCIVFSQWTVNSGQMSGKNLTVVHFVNEQTGWIVGGSDDSELLKTTDSGQHWEKKYLNISPYYITSLFFANPDTGWAVCGSTLQGGQVLKTTNGGDSWRSVRTIWTNLRSVFFIDETTGWAVGGLNGSTAIILKTTDGGERWFVQTNPSKAHLTSVSFVDENYGWAVGLEGAVLNTTNGGETWNKQDYSSEFNLYSVHFYDRNIGWAAGYLGILKTTDGGLNWNQSSGRYKIYSMKFFDQNIGWAVGSWNILLTTDGGLSWTINTETWRSLNSVDFVSPDVGWAVGGGGQIVKSVDGGINWDNMFSGPNAYMGSVFFTDINTGWVAGSSAHNGVLFKTTNGGDSWVTLNNFNYNCSNDIWFDKDANIGYAVGDKIIKTTNGGSDWINVFSVDDIVFHKSHFVNKDTGWVVGNEFSGLRGFIYNTTDGGLNWFEQYRTDVSNYSKYLYSIEFLDEKSGWVGGGSSGDANSIFLYTNDGGISWQEYPVESTSFIVSIDFADLNKGIAVSDNGQILRTIDGGITWKVNNRYYGGNNYNIHFVDKMHGWIACYNLKYRVLRTANGGINWAYDEIPVNKKINDLYFINTEVGYAVGDNFILKTTNGGITFVETEIENPVSFSLAQNNPNPFNPSTNIEFSIKEEGTYELSVYNILGEKIMVLFDKPFIPGSYSENFNATGLSSGVYIYHLKGKNVNLSKKMIYLK